MYERVIKGTKILAVIKIAYSRDKDQTRKTDTHNIEHSITKIIRIKVNPLKPGNMDQVHR